MTLTPRGILAATAVLTVVAACERTPAAPADTPAPQVVADGAVSARIEQSALVIRNTSSAAIRAGALEHELATTALILWCFGSAECGDAIAPGAELRIPLADVQGYTVAARTILVHWWNAAESPPGTGAPVRTLSVPVGGT